MRPAKLICMKVFIFTGLVVLLSACHEEEMDVIEDNDHTSSDDASPGARDGRNDEVDPSDSDDMELFEEELLSPHEGGERIVIPLEETPSQMEAIEARDRIDGMGVRKAFTPDKARRFVVIVSDGAANTGSVLDMWNQAYGYALARGFVKEMKGSYMGGWSTPGEIRNEIVRWVNAYANEGIPQGEITLLVIGKSQGSARQYKTMYNSYNNDHNGYFKNFYKVGWVLIDPHEPGAPGKSGRCGHWYDYVVFDCNKDFNSGNWNNYYNLYLYFRWTYWIARGQLRINSTYERVDPLIQGYAMCGGDPAGNTPRKWWTAALWRQMNNGHFNIDQSCSSARLIYNTLKWATENKAIWPAHTSVPYTKLTDTLPYNSPDCIYD